MDCIFFWKGTLQIQYLECIELYILYCKSLTGIGVGCKNISFGMLLPSCKYFFYLTIYVCTIFYHLFFVY